MIISYIKYNFFLSAGKTLMVLFSHRYVDFTSLYPWCNSMTRTVVGHPRIITENFDLDISRYFGLIK